MRTTANTAAYYRVILDAIPIPVFLVDDDVRFLDYNEAAAGLIKADRAQVLQHRGGEVLHCLNSNKSPAGCGHSVHCANCVIRNSVTHAIVGSPVRQHRSRMELQTPGGVAKMDFLVTTTPLEIENRRRVLLILEDVSELLALRGIIPICARCKAVRDDRQYWQQLESYFQSHMHLDFSHGLCPKCTRELYPDCADDLEDGRN